MSKNHENFTMNQNICAWFQEGMSQLVRLTDRWLKLDFRGKSGDIVKFHCLGNILREVKWMFEPCSCSRQYFSVPDILSKLDGYHEANFLNFNLLYILKTFWRIFRPKNRFNTSCNIFPYLLGSAMDSQIIIHGCSTNKLSVIDLIFSDIPRYVILI